jgi:hypothetical protein
MVKAEYNVKYLRDVNSLSMDYLSFGDSSFDDSFDDLFDDSFAEILASSWDSIQEY